MELKNFVDFAYSMVNMDEVKNGNFVLPKEMIFDLNPSTHREIHKEIMNEVKVYQKNDLDKEFEVEIFDINFKFKKNVN